MSTPPTLKRDNWTNEEVIHLLEGMKLFTVDGKPCQDMIYTYNEVLDHAKIQFQDFTRPIDGPGALAFDPVEKVIYHVGARLPR